MIEKVVGKWGKRQQKSHPENQTGKRGIHCLAAEQITNTYVCAHVGAQLAGQSLLFVPDELSQLPEDLVSQEGLLTVSEVSVREGQYTAQSQLLTQ